MAMMKKVKKYIDYALSLVSKAIREKKYRNENSTLKYLFYPCKNSKDMVVVFSACTRVGIPARYNYIRTLDSIEVNRLYILDDEGDDQRGSYYLGQYPEFYTEKAVIELITKVTDKYSFENLYFAGSSKGGWSALNIAASMEGRVKAVIIGAPQYKLGQYLQAPANMTTLNFVKGFLHDDEIVIDELDNHIRNKIRGLHNTKVYLHYSKQEHTYDEHIIYLLNDLKQITSVDENVANYSDHQDVSLYFPKYLKETVNMLIKR